LAILLITLNSQAVATLIQADFAYWFKSDRSHFAASSANWKAAHHKAKFNACNAVLTGLDSLTVFIHICQAFIALHTQASIGAVNAISVVNCHNHLPVSNACCSSVNNHCFHISSDDTCLPASSQVYHSAFFILSHTLHSDVSAQKKSAIQYNHSHIPAAILLHKYSAVLHIVFCAISASH
jgi:hypothetical protein